MIRYIKGIYAMTYDSGIVVETPSGIGFEINIPKNSALYRYGEGEEIMVFTEMIVREDAMSLYGFHNRESLELFKLLTTVSGIGPKGAMGIMGAMSPEELKRAIAFEDVKEISKAPGVGKKTAERLVLELKDKVGGFDTDAVYKGDLSPDGSKASTEGNQRAEAISALIALGYGKSEAFDAVAHISEDDLTVEEYIKMALKRLF